MWQGLWAALKGFAVAIGWAKQVSDQATGRKLESAKQMEATLAKVAEVNADLGDPCYIKRVRDASTRD